MDIYGLSLNGRAVNMSTKEGRGRKEKSTRWRRRGGMVDVIYLFDWSLSDVDLVDHDDGER